MATGDCALCHKKPSRMLMTSRVGHSRTLQQLQSPACRTKYGIQAITPIVARRIGIGNRSRVHVPAALDIRVLAFALAPPAPPPAGQRVSHGHSVHLVRGVVQGAHLSIVIEAAVDEGTVPWLPKRWGTRDDLVEIAHVGIHVVNLTSRAIGDMRGIARAVSPSGHRGGVVGRAESDVVAFPIREERDGLRGQDVGGLVQVKSRI
mmetsp:Transcript_1670/g.4798  ORF Transcript_1670/g.4798 Transcript_1670/m.4798 type:complete len:205 (-) Transcript_1670:231-845(-)